MPEYVLKRSGTDYYVKSDGDVLIDHVTMGSRNKPTVYADAWAALSVVKAMDEIVNESDGDATLFEYDLEIWNPDNWVEPEPEPEKRYVVAGVDTQDEARWLFTGINPYKGKIDTWSANHDSVLSGAETFINRLGTTEHNALRIMNIQGGKLVEVPFVEEIGSVEA
ncbi:hypothetical protein ACRHK7_00385 [Weissella tructae]|uniref:hypothetical protein n=1 Tax=Weissella tructae TaxID=887702 RepID=UPI003D8A5DC0